jgi:hypothetical protein
MPESRTRDAPVRPGPHFWSPGPHAFRPGLGASASLASAGLKLPWSVRPESDPGSPAGETGSEPGRTDCPPSETGCPAGRTDRPDRRTDRPDRRTDRPDGRTDRPDRRTGSERGRTGSELGRSRSERGRSGSERGRCDSERGRCGSEWGRSGSVRAWLSRGTTAQDEFMTGDGPDVSATCRRHVGRSRRHDYDFHGSGFSRGAADWRSIGTTVALDQSDSFGNVSQRSIKEMTSWPVRSRSSCR